MTIEDFELKGIIKNQTKAIFEHAIKHKFKPFVLKTNIETGEGKSPLKPKSEWDLFILNNCRDGIYTGTFTNNNVGIRCGVNSGIIVIDVDTYNNMKGWKKVLIDGNYSTIEDFNKNWNGPIVKTPSNGYHYYFKYNENDADHYYNDIEGIDFQTDGKFITYAGSTYISCYPNENEMHKKRVHKCNSEVTHSEFCEYRGKKYEWLKSPDDYDIPELPNFLRNHFIKIKKDTPINKINTYTNISCETLDEIIPHLSPLSSDFEDWRDVMWCLISLGASLEQCQEFSKYTKRDNYDSKYVESFYNNGSSIKYNVGRLKNLCRRADMDETEFKRIFSQVDDKYIDSLINKGDVGLAKLYSLSYKKDFITIQKENSKSVYYMAYRFDTKLKLWLISSSTHVCQNITSILEPIISNKIKKIEKEIYNLSNIENNEDLKKNKNVIKKLEEQKNTLCKVFSKIHSNNGLECIYSQVKTLIENKQFEDVINACVYELPVKNGKVINFKTLEVRDRTVSDYWSFECPVSYNPNSNCKNAIEYFESLTKVKGSNLVRKDYYEYMINVLGYSLTKEVGEQSFYILNGNGSNGKSLLMNIMDKILNKDYKVADTKLFDISVKSSHSENLHALKGSRLVTLSEPKRNQQLDSDLLKKLSGDEKIPSRGLNEKQEDGWIPTFKVFFLCNQVPEIKSEKAIRRRINLLPFENEFQQNPIYKEKLMNDYLDEIFTLLAQRAHQYYTPNRNLKMPECCKDATDDLLVENSTILTFLNGCDYIERKDNEKCKTTELYTKYVNYCKDSCIKESSQSDFNQQIIEQGIQKKRTNTGFIFVGIKILSDYERINKIQTHQQQENNRLLEEEEEEKEEEYNKIDEQNNQIEIKNNNCEYPNCKGTCKNNCNLDHSDRSTFNICSDHGDFCSTCHKKFTY